MVGEAPDRQGYRCHADGLRNVRRLNIDLSSRAVEWPR